MQSAVSNILAFDAAPAPGGITTKLESRLLSSKTLSKEVNIVVLSLHSALEPSEEDDDELSSRLHEPQMVDSSTTLDQRGAIEVSEVNSSGSGDDSSGRSDSARGSDSFQHGTSSLFLVIILPLIEQATFYYFQTMPRRL